VGQSAYKLVVHTHAPTSTQRHKQTCTHMRAWMLTPGQFIMGQIDITQVLQPFQIWCV